VEKFERALLETHTLPRNLILRLDRVPLLIDAYSLGKFPRRLASIKKGTRSRRRSDCAAACAFSSSARSDFSTRAKTSAGDFINHHRRAEKFL